MSTPETRALHDLLITAAREQPSHPAVIDPAGTTAMNYAALDRLSDRLADRLRAMGVERGDRVGIYLRKSTDSIASIFGILKAGAAYVPVDPTAPASRNAYIHNNCQVRVTIVEERFLEAYSDELCGLGRMPQVIRVQEAGTGSGLTTALDALDDHVPAPALPAVRSFPDDLAYILYTSGSTGKPKGVMLSHLNALSFVDWCSDIFRPLPDDVFSSHAPFHFDLSILDIYLPLKHGATLALIGEEASKDPQALSRIISTRRITVRYSAPSILSLLAQFGQIAAHDYSSLRIVLFAGEVFPIAHLRSFTSQVPRPTYFNLYGPTETNVCTSFQIPREIPPDRGDPYPIGKTCWNLEGRVVDTEGCDVAAGTEGELCIAGPNVMQGYWDLPDQTARGFLPSGPDGKRWYRTGDLVVEDDHGDYRYVGRRDRMVKKRGYRVELGEIEACLYRHAAISEAAVVALPDDAVGVRVKAHIRCRPGKRPSIIDLKSFCAQTLPLYMVPDQFSFHEVLPKTSTDKVDYVTLKNLG